MTTYITFENAICFAVGMAVIYMMFRAMGVFVFLLLISLSLSANAQTSVTVANWPFDQLTFTNSIPVTIVEDNAPDRMPAVLAGMGFGLTCCGFGWILRMGKKTTTDF